MRLRAMPTEKPRLYITLTPELKRALDSFQAETGLARSALIAQLLSESVPVIDAMTEAYRAAKQSPAAAVDRMRDAVRHAHGKLSQASLSLEQTAKHRRLRKSTSK